MPCYSQLYYSSKELWMVFGGAWRESINFTYFGWHLHHGKAPLVLLWKEISSRIAFHSTKPKERKLRWKVRTIHRFLCKLQEKQERTPYWLLCVQSKWIGNYFHKEQKRWERRKNESEKKILRKSWNGNRVNGVFIHSIKQSYKVFLFFSFCIREKKSIWHFFFSAVEDLSRRAISTRLCNQATIFKKV